MDPAKSFERSMRIAGGAALVFGVIHLTTPYLVYGGRHPIHPVKDPFIRWEVFNNEIALGILFVWAAAQAWAASASWAQRDRATLVTAVGLGAFFALDALYLLVWPMPGSAGMKVANYVVAALLLGSALVCARATRLLVGNPRAAAC